MAEEPRVSYKVLAVDVIVVAKEGGNHDWAAYIGSVPGFNHDKEWKTVRETGAKLPESVARVLFPAFADLRWRP